MRGRKEAAPGVTSTEGDRAERAAFPDEANSKYQFTMKLGPIASILMTGKENALPGREIRRILHLKDAREVTAQVEQERHNGVPICASCDGSRPGYYLAASAGELAGYNASLRRRIKAVSVTLEALEAVLEKWRRGHE